MDLVDRIETTRFLGSEFLTWIWFKLELLEGSFALGELGSGELWFDNQLVLASWADDSEKVTLRGAAPSSSPEASEALRQGKIPFRAALRLVVGQEEYLFSFNARAFSVSGVKLPQVLTEDNDERFYERMRLLEQLDQALICLYDEFLALRLSSLWDKEFAPAIRAWVRGKESLDAKGYAGLLKRAQSEREASRRRGR